MDADQDAASQTSAASAEAVDRALDFVRVLIDRYISYHDHKASMAFTGLTLFTGVAGAALVTDAWPPSWGSYSTPLAVAAVTALWLGVLVHLRFQLRRRRWAALRIAGCERVLAQWIMSPPSKAELSPRKRDTFNTSWCVNYADFLWPQKAAVLAIDPANEDDPATYPSVLVDAWVSQEERGTAALRHERLITLAGWVMYVLVVAYTVAKSSCDGMAV
jgi:hypothetical protein